MAWEVNVRIRLCSVAVFSLSAGSLRKIGWIRSHVLMTTVWLSSVGRPSPTPNPARGKSQCLRILSGRGW